MDLTTIFLTGFANGFGTLTALEVWTYIKKRDLHKHPSNLIEDIINRGRNGES